MGKEEPDEGSAKIVRQNIVMNYFEQNHADASNFSKPALDVVQTNSQRQSYNLIFVPQGFC